MTPSPIATRLYQALPYNLKRVTVAEYPIAQYHADFALLPYRLVVECDGHEWHSTPEQRAHDAKRDRAMARLGWTVMRFTGREIWADAAGCVGEIEAMVRRRWWWVFWG